MPASTLDHLRALLRGGHALTQSDIAGRLDISKRQARRLITQLRTDGLPIQEDRRGRAKEYRLPPEEQSTAVSLSLSEREALAVVLAAAAVKSGSAPVPLGRELQRAFGQITEALSGQVVTFEPRSLQRQLHVRDTGSVDVDGDLFLELLGAIANRQRLSMDYYTASTGTFHEGRLIEPYVLARRGSSWLCVAHDPGKEAMRDFAITRMEAVQPADPGSNGGDYAIPDDFDPEIYFSGRFEALSGEEAHVVRLQVDADLAPYFRSKDYHRTQVIEEETAEGDLIVSYEVVGLEEIATFVQGWGPGVRVLEPTALQKKVVGEARAVLDMYDAGPDDPRTDDPRLEDRGTVDSSTEDRGTVDTTCPGS